MVLQKKRFFYDEDPEEEEVVETLDPVYFYYANGKVAGVTLVGRRQLQEPAESQDPEFVSHWDGLSEEEKSDVASGSVWATTEWGICQICINGFYAQ